MRQVLLATAAVAAMMGGAQAATLTINSSDFTITNQFNRITSFGFTIALNPANLMAGASYDETDLSSVNYFVNGDLRPSGSPSGFPAFALNRNITGADFIAQGSSLSFTIDGGADLTDGLQLSEMIGGFVFNGREVGTGRYHPALLQLAADGTGSMRNSNNFGGVNPGSNEVVDVDFGEEYIIGLTAPVGTTIAAAQLAPVPIPASFWALGAGLVLLARRRRNA